MRVLFTVFLNFILFENSLALVEDAMHPVRCSMVFWVSTASLGHSFMPNVRAGVRWKKKKIKGMSWPTELHLGNPYSFQIVEAELKQLIFSCENSTSN